ncbi:hypothetical protein AVEN_125018-1 [Araneus ventricosus]|uniref:Uncharacterized protein n=1 Tax=Araneus ventricosus TaxID=182803 RepID=A0A4Y2GVU7_ARAVE|nr:hypothetical protein AVEN_125018-1 [Araneus ventricosus]
MGISDEAGPCCFASTSSSSLLNVGGGQEICRTEKLYLKFREWCSATSSIGIERVPIFAPTKPKKDGHYHNQKACVTKGVQSNLGSLAFRMSL